MLIIALVLALIGLVALVFAVVTSNELVAWVCIGASVLGVVLLIIDALQERQRRDAGGPDRETEAHEKEAHEKEAGDDERDLVDYPEEVPDEAEGTGDAAADESPEKAATEASDDRAK
jgi:hypothetical protein